VLTLLAGAGEGFDLLHVRQKMEQSTNRARRGFGRTTSSTLLLFWGVWQGQVGEVYRSPADVAQT
jgi:hypothetical protein